jgi:O-methyltransferase involved in polyketide biosynthesis
VPAWLTFAAIDFERQTLREGLRAGGFDEARETFFSLLGVVPYLTEDAVWSTLRFIAGTPGSAHVAFDYSDPPGALVGDGRAQHLDRASRVASIGEPWLTHFVPAELHARMRTLGFTRVEDLGPAEVAERYLGAPHAERRAGGHLLYATNVRGQ